MVLHHAELLQRSERGRGIHRGLGNRPRGEMSAPCGDTQPSGEHGPRKDDAIRQALQGSGQDDGERGGARTLGGDAGREVIRQVLGPFRQEA